MSATRILNLAEYATLMIVLALLALAGWCLT